MMAAAAGMVPPSPAPLPPSGLGGAGGPIVLEWAWRARGDRVRLGMVNKIPAADVAEAQPVRFAARIADVPSFAALLIKGAVNQTQDAHGFYTSLKASCSMHEANDADWAEGTKGESAIGTPEHGVSGERRPIQHSDPASP